MSAWAGKTYQVDGDWLDRHEEHWYAVGRASAFEDLGKLTMEDASVQWTQGADGAANMLRALAKEFTKKGAELRRSIPPLDTAKPDAL